MAFSITSDLSLADFDAIEALLRTSYWAAERPRDDIQASFRSPACIPFFVLDGDGKTVGFARVVTDRLTIAWLCDVMIHPDQRGAGLSKMLVRTIMAHSDLDRPGVRMVLGTKDAHGLYEQFGFFRRELMWRHAQGAAETKGF